MRLSHISRPDSFSCLCTHGREGAMVFNKRRVFLIIIAVAIIATMWIARYPLLYRYYLWRLNHTVEGSEITDLCERIQALGPHVVSLLVRTYEDVGASVRTR